MRIVLDSAILVRANQRATGLASVLLRELLQRGHLLIVSVSLLEEVDRVLHYPRLVKRFDLAVPKIVQFVAFLTASGKFIDVDQTAPVPIKDPKDIHVLQTAISGKADYLCTLDRHFRDEAVITFCADRGIAIVSDLDLLRVIRKVSPS